MAFEIAAILLVYLTGCALTAWAMRPAVTDDGECHKSKKGENDGT